MHVHISLCIIMLTILASLWFLDRAKKDSMASWYKWIAYVFITAGFVMLICTAVCGICKMCHKGGCGSKGSQEMCAPHRGGGDCHMDKKGCGHDMVSHGCGMSKGHGCEMEKKDACCADGKGEGHGHGMKKCVVKEEVIVGDSSAPHVGH